MAKLTRGERFKDARIVYNKNGKQTMDEVETATGIGKSLIQALEDDGSTRSPGYDKVAKLAAHYHVTADFLLGLTDDPHPQKTAIDDLGISPGVAAKFIFAKSYNTSDCDISAKYNRVLESNNVWALLLLIADYATAVKVDSIYRALVRQYDGGPIDEESICTELINKSQEYYDTDIDMCDFLQAKANIADWRNGDSMVSLGMNEFDLSEIWSLRITRQLEEVLASIRGGIEDGID